MAEIQTHDLPTFHMLEQGTDEWLQWRSEGVTATDVAAILELSPYSTAWSIWAEKKGIKAPDDLSKNPHVQRGIAREPVARAIANQHTGTLFAPVCISHPSYPFLRASLDGYDAVSKTVLEIKVPSEGNYEDFDGQLERYMPQLQTQLLVSGASRNVFFVLHPFDDEKFRFAEVLPDPEFHRLILEKAQDFYDRFLIGSEEPEKTSGSDVFYPNDSAELAAWTGAAEQIRRLSARVKALKAEQDSLSKLLKSHQEVIADILHANQQALGECAGVRLKISDVTPAIDYKRVVEHLERDQGIQVPPELLDRCRKSVKSATRQTLTVTDNTIPKGIIDTDISEEIAAVSDALAKKTKMF